MPCCLSREQRFRHSWALASCQCPAMWYLGCCVYVCAGLCGCALCEGVGDFVVVLTATCNFASPLFLTTPFKPFECTATFAINRFYHYVVFFTAGDCGLLLPPTAYLLCVRGIHYLSECTVCCDGLRAGRGKSGSQFSWKFV